MWLKVLRKFTMSHRNLGFFSSFLLRSVVEADQPLQYFCIYSLRGLKDTSKIEVTKSLVLCSYLLSKGLASEKE